MATDGATLCSARIGPRKEKKNEWREMLRYLHSRSDRTRFQRRVGSVIVIEKEALRHEMERKAGQRQKQGVSVGYCSCGAAYPPRNSRGGNRKTRRQRQRVNRGRLRDNRLASRILAKSLNPIEGGSYSAWVDYWPYADDYLRPVRLRTHSETWRHSRPQRIAYNHDHNKGRVQDSPVSIYTIKCHVHIKYN